MLGDTEVMSSIESLLIYATIFTCLGFGTLLLCLYKSVDDENEEDSKSD